MHNYIEKEERDSILRKFDDLCRLHAKVDYQCIDSDDERLEITMKFARLVSYLTVKLNEIAKEKGVDPKQDISVESL